MAYALPQYTQTKVPMEHLHRAVQRDERFCVWGIWDGHVVSYAWARGCVEEGVCVRV